jgi:hypothetical protein
MNSQNDAVAPIEAENLEIDGETFSIEDIASREVQMCMCICSYGPIN